MANELRIGVAVHTLDKIPYERELVVHAGTRLARNVVLQELETKWCTVGYKHVWPDGDWTFIPSHRIINIDVSFPDEEESDGS